MNDSRHMFRKLLWETLEDRRLLVSDFGATNPIQPLDVNLDAFVSPIDALIVINHLNSESGGAISEPTETGFIDVSGDRSVSPIDALMVVNELNASEPILAASLVKDSAPSDSVNRDFLTNDYSLKLGVNNGSTTSVEARINGQTSDAFTNVAAYVNTDSILTMSAIDEIAGSPLEDGLHFVELKLGEEILSFELEVDRSNPAIITKPTDTIRQTFEQFTVGFSESVVSPNSEVGNFNLVVVGGASDGEVIPISEVTTELGFQFDFHLENKLPDQQYELTILPEIFDAAGNTILAGTELPFTIADPAGVSEFSPRNGDGKVSLTRETIIRFDEPVDPATVTEDTFYVIAGGKRVDGRVRVSSTERFATFFYDSPLPASTRVRAVVDGNSIFGRDGFALDANGDNEPGGIGTAEFSTLAVTRIPGTDVWGYVYESNRKDANGNDIPVVGARIEVDALPGVYATTDETGYFILEDMPAPDFFVHVNGLHAESPDGFYFPNVGKPFHSIPGESVQLEMDGEPFNVYLPLFSEDDFTQIVPKQPTEIGFGEAAKQELFAMHPDIDPGVWDRMKLDVPADSLYFDDGTAGTQVQISPVAPDRIPAPLPAGVDPTIVWSVQGGGATNFDVPVPITYPNVDGLAPRESRFIYSFDHDAGAWVTIGTGTVSGDGLTIESDPGVGIRAPGWGFVPPEPEIEHRDDLNRPGPCEDGTNLRDFIAQGTATFFNGLNALIGVVDTIPGTGTVPGLDQALSASSLMTGVAAEVIANGRITNQGWADIGIWAAGIAWRDPVTGTLIDAYGLYRAVNNLAGTANATADAAGRLFDQLERCISGVAGAGEGESESGLSDRLVSLASTMNNTADNLEKFSAALMEIAEIRDLTGGEESDDEVLLARLTTAIGDIDHVANYFNFNNGGSAASHIGALEENYRSVERDFQERYSNAFEPAENARFSIEVNGIVINRGNANDVGRISVNLPADELVRITYTDPIYGELVVKEFRTGTSGSLNSNITFLAPEVGLDSDGDRLIDAIENTIGTLPSESDSDDDGIDDFSEIENGTDPLGGRGFPTGIISSIPFFGNAISISLEASLANDRSATLALGDSGVAFADVSRFDNPIVVSQLELDGFSHEIKSEPTLDVTVVANSLGLHFVDTTDPILPEEAGTLEIAGGATSVDIFDGIAYAGTRQGTIVAADIRTGERLQELHVTSGPIRHMARERSTLYAITSANELFVIDLSGFEAVVRGSVALPANAHKVFVGNDVAYVSDGDDGFSTVDVSDPDNPLAISGPDTPIVQAANLHTITNGSGLALVAAGNRGLEIHDGSDPADTYEFLTQIDTPGSANEVAIASGIAFVADGAAGLQVISYLPFDNQGQAPTVTATFEAEDVDASAVGIQVPEGTSIPVFATITDDVQVRNVELIVNGTVVDNDISFPFDFSAIVPRIDTEGPTLRVRLRAFDTGGDSTFSDALEFDVVADSVQPTLVATTPADGQRVFYTPSLELRFSEAISATDLNLSQFELLELGADEALGGGDDTAIELVDFNLMASDQRLTLYLESELATGSFHLSIATDQILDRAGNELNAAIGLSFEVGSASGVVAQSGTPSNARIPSANPLQLISFEIPGADSNSTIDFPILRSDGTSGTVSVAPSQIDGDRTSYVVPAAATTGNITLPNEPGSSFLLQIVPTVDSLIVGAINEIDGDWIASLTLRGSGFMEGDGAYRFGLDELIDPDAASEKVDVILGYEFENDAAIVQLPLSGDVFGAITVTTAGGTSRPWLMDVEALVGTADSGTPANPALASANPGGTIEIAGNGLTADTGVVARWTDVDGVPQWELLKPTSVNPDGTRAVVAVPDFFNGANPIQLFGSDTAPILQIVPTISSATAEGLDSASIIGRGFEERVGNAVTFAGNIVESTNLNQPPIDVLNSTFSNGRIVATEPAHGFGTIELSTAGGTASAELNWMKPDSELTAVAIAREDQHLWMLAMPLRSSARSLLKIDMSSGEVVASFSGMPNGSNSLTRLESNTSIDGEVVPAGTLVLADIDGNLFAVDSSTGSTTPLTTWTTGDRILGIGIDSPNGLIYQLHLPPYFGSGARPLLQVVVRDLSNGTEVDRWDTSFRSVAPGGDHGALTFDSATNSSWASYLNTAVQYDSQGVEIKRVDLLAQSFSGAAQGVAFDGDQNLLVASSARVVSRIDPDFSPLRAATTQSDAFDTQVPLLGQAELEQARIAAIELWAMAGLSIKEQEHLWTVDVQIRGLADGYLGLGSAKKILIDDDGAKLGWGENGYDLVTVLAHEFGHSLGLLDSSDEITSLMHFELGTKSSKRPTAEIVDLLLSDSLG